MQDSGLGVEELIGRFLPSGLRQAVVTDISRDGMLEGPNLPLYEGIKRRFEGLKVVVSGGVSSSADIVRTSEMGMDGIIVGKAVYEGRISLKDLEKLCLQNG